MRAFVVIASLVVLASADVKHLYDAPYKTSSVHYGGSGSGSSFGGSSTGASHFGGSGSGSSHYGTTGFSDPVVNFVPTTTTTTHNYVKPSVVTTGQYVQPAYQTSYVQHAPVVSHTVSRFGSQSVGAVPQYVSTGHGASYGGASYGGAVNSGFGAVNGGKFHDTTSYGSNVHYRTTLVKQTAPIVTKSSYVFAAPEDHEEIQRDQTIVLPRPRQHYKVVFIKAPATTIVNTPSAALAPQTQEKTLIYVLSDKKKIENHIDLPQLDEVKPQKPDVFFIKYNKPTEYVKGHAQYETVNAVHGAENGAINGVANQVNHNGHLQDESSGPEQAQVANHIYNAVQSGGLESGVNAVEGLAQTGHSISTFGGSAPSRGNFETVTTTVHKPTTTFVSGSSEPSYSTGSSFSSGSVQPSYTSGSSYTTGSVQPSYSTQYVQQPASVSYGTTSSGSAAYPEQGYNYQTSGGDTSYSHSASGCTTC